MKHIFILLVLLVTFTGCKKNTPARNVSVMRNKQSLINSWYGKDHFKPGVIGPEEPLNKNTGDPAFESDAGSFNPNPQTTPASSSPSQPANQTPNTQSTSPSAAPSNAVNQTSELNLESIQEDSDQLLQDKELIVTIVELDTDLDQPGMEENFKEEGLHSELAEPLLLSTLDE